MILLGIVVVHAAWLQTADTTSYVVLNHGRVAGGMVVVEDDSSTVVRHQYVDRYSSVRLGTRYAFSAQGALSSAEVRRLNPDGNVGEVVERWAVFGDSVRWSVRVPSGIGFVETPGSALNDPNAFYNATSRTPFDEALLARFLLRQPQRTARLWPRGSASLDVVVDTSVQTPLGRTHLRLVMVFFGDAAPFGIWLDDRDQLFASQADWFITVRRGGESALPTLRRIEFAHEDARGDALARQVTHRADETLVIRSGELFDSERGVIRPRTTVVIRGDRIVAVGPADSVVVPSGATVIEAAGKTVIPGLWDMHGHSPLRAQSRANALRLAAGITTIRDMAADVDFVVPYRDRAAAGLLASPRLILAGFIEGPGERAGPTDVIVNTANEARAWVARYDSLGYRQIKLYGLVRPDLVGVIADEARRRGLRVSGHVPDGLRVPDAVRLGYHEITHAEFLFRAFLPDSLQHPPAAGNAIIRGMVKVDGEGMTQLIELLRSTRTVVEPTLNYYQPRFGAPALQTVWDSTFGRLVKRLHDGGVILVAGTDGGAARYLIELQLYERAGIPAAQVLQIATINAARVMNDEAGYGSIAPGKVADIVVVNGRPAERISELANIETVIRAGRIYRAAELRAAISRLR